MADKISGKIGEQVVQLEWTARKPDWSDPIVYAPALPGVLVALVGLWVAHRLTVARESRKALLELCEDLKKRVDEAATAANEAWLCAAGPDRDVKVKETKWLLQRAGNAATNLKRKTALGIFGRKRHGVPLIDVVAEIAELRRVATADPFEDTSRPANADKTETVIATAGLIYDRIDQLLTG